MKLVNIVLSSDNNYAQHLGVVLCSIFENKKFDYNINIHVIDGGISDENKKRLGELEKKYNFLIKYLYIDSSLLPNLVINGHITESAYYRILIPKLLDSNIDKVLYLDSDLVVLDDIARLFNFEINNYFAAVVESSSSNGRKYFNSGVILMNLKKWRAEKITEKTLEYIKNNPDKLEFWDQDALNAVLFGKCLFLDSIFNFEISGSERKYNKKIKPFIIHYIGNVKPWKFSYIGPFKDVYFKYLELTPWKNYKHRDKNFINFIKKMFFLFLPKSFLSFLLKIKSKI